MSLVSSVWINQIKFQTKKFFVQRKLKRSHKMDDPEIQETVEAILGPGAKVVDCEKKSSIKEEEVLYINGIPVTLEGRDGLAIKQALVTGQVPPCDLLNSLLIKTGILKAPVKLDTSLSVKSTTVTTEEVKVSRAGRVVDERSRETKESNYYSSALTEIFEPIKVIPTSELLNGEYSNVQYAENHGKYYDNNGYETGSDRKFGSCSSASSYESEEPVPVSSYQPKPCLSKDSGHLSNSMSATKVDFTQSSIDSLSSLDETDYLTDQFKKCAFNRSNGFYNGYTENILPTIFGTVASDLTPKDCSNRRSLPQTPQTKSFANIFNGEAGQDGSAESTFQQENALVYRDGNLISGPLDALIQHMVPTDQYYPDRAYLFAFLLSSRLFIKPHDLLAKVRTLCETQQGLAGKPTGSTAQTRFAEHLVQLLAEWTETFPYDFRDERMMEHVRKITQQCCAINSTLRANVSALLHNLHPRLTALEAYEKSFENQCTNADENFTDISEICSNPATLAQQLTHVELERLSFIGPEEFVQAFAKENPNLETSFKDMKKTHNLEQYVQWFNRLSYFVATQVCKYQKKKMRVRVVEYWIETGRECFNIGNFNSLMAIIAGLNMSPISRLKKTWSKIHSGKFAILEHQMDPSSNFSSYRSTLKAAMWRSEGATDQRQRIVIPFFSLLVKDLYFLNQGCSNRLPNGHINFDKFWQLAKQVTEFMAWKQVTCPFEKDAKIINLLQHGPILNENALALASFECEPPDNNQEKERCKTLKADPSAN
ncbi:ras-GEF domain-containing family member 1B-like isoform X2 [Diorhabda carinulata]|uniref:ras-GEF domain-containing family member 1B-like isoform X2 n=1 Tax=Diorhabda carinulata TaxID=1163345 RepID=UPI0025A2E7F7|nr:ras-GEF domain-containing family member 1B-like isoform X2 [Diorhabda carinulata]